MTKTALVTGGSRGIGKCVVDLLRAKGWEVIAPTRAELDFDSDISMYTHLMANAAVNFDALIFCHGKWYWADPPILGDSEYEYQFRQRVVHPQILMQGMLNIGDIKSVTAVSSTRAFIGGVANGPYAVACEAQVNMITGYAREYGRGVRFNCVCPGLTDTDMGQDVIKTGGAKPGAAMQPPEVVAAEIVRLIESDDNGRVMRVVDSKVTEARWTW